MEVNRTEPFPSLRIPCWNFAGSCFQPLWWWSWVSSSRAGPSATCGTSSTWSGSLCCSTDSTVSNENPWTQPEHADPRWQPRRSGVAWVLGKGPIWFVTIQFLRNLRMGPINYTVCPLQAFSLLIGPGSVFTTFHFLSKFWMGPISYRGFFSESLSSLA